MSGSLGIATLQTEVDLRGLQRGLAQGQQQTQNLTNKIGQAANVAFATATAAAAAFVVSSVNEFQTFERGMAEVFTLMPNMTASAMAQMEEDVLTFGQAVGRTSDETIPALYQSISAGVPAANVFDFMQVASDAALGGVTSLEVAVDGISSAVNAYGAEALSAQQASDLMFTAVKGGKTTFGDLAGSLFNVIPTAASLGVEFGNITAALAAMTAQGTPTSVATTQLRQLLIELSKDGSKTADTFERLAGESFVDFIASGGNLQGALQMLEAAAADSGLRLSDMFGSVEAGAAALTLTGSGTEKFTAELNAAASAAGATATAAETMGETGAQAVARLTASFEALKIMVGEEVAPTIADFAEKAVKQISLMTSTTKFNDLVGALRDTGLSVGEVNDIVGDGRAQFDLWRTAADMEDDLARNEVGMRRMELALQGLNLGLEDQRTIITSTGGAYRVTTNDLSEFVDLMEQFTSDLQPAATGMEYWALATEQVTVATVEAAEAVEVATVDTSLLALDVIHATNAIEGMTLSQEASEEATRAQAEATAAATARMADYFVAATQATDAVGFFSTTTTDAGAVLVDTTVNQSSLNQAMYDAAAAAGASATELAVLGVATGVLSAEQAEAALKTAILQAGVAELAAAYVAGDLSISGLRTQMGLLVADVNNMDVEIGASTGEVDIYAGSISTAGAAALTAAEQIGGLRTAAEDAAGDYQIHFEITQNGSVPNVNGGYGGSSGAGNVAPEDGYALGGFTGYGPASEIAGFVHRNEFVLPPEAVDQVGLPFLENLRAGRVPEPEFDFAALDIGPMRRRSASDSPADDRDRGKMAVTIDLRNSQIYGVTDFKRVIRDAMAEVGHQADVWIKTR